jgi:hypothetical protein
MFKISFQEFNEFQFFLSKVVALFKQHIYGVKCDFYVEAYHILDEQNIEIPEDLVQIEYNITYYYDDIYDIQRKTEIISISKTFLDLSLDEIKEKVLKIRDFMLNDNEKKPVSYYTKLDI